MFNLLIALISGVLIGWNFHAFYLQLTPPNILKNEINISTQSPQIIEKELPQKVIEVVKFVEKNTTIMNPSKEKTTPPKVDTIDLFYQALEQNLFGDAMALYLEATNQKLPLYRSTLEEYFKIKSTTAPQEAITQMLEFNELEPDHQTVSLILIESYKSIKKYKKSIEIITQLIETATPSQLDALYLNLIETSQSYMDELNASQKFQNLVTFLNERIEAGIKVPFYSYSLARHYEEMGQHNEAIALLKELEYDYDYGEKAKQQLEIINQKETQKSEYTHQLSLNKVGEHFMLEVSIENTPLTLLLDTGATLTMVNENKLPILTLVHDNILLNTAGGQINAQLKVADVFSIGEIELHKFEIVSSSFEQEEADGLLGMNFFKEFNFKIDQEKALLYLRKKENKVAL